ncbi:hypothetical protein NRY67_16340 [Acidithiobacillus ferrooxidans]|nr:hypothetical protein [Acidithiobacillus ferrooxidans]
MYPFVDAQMYSLLPCRRRLDLCIHCRIVAQRLRKLGRTAHTLDIDATRIVAEKHFAEWNYKGERGYMLMVGHLAEAGS